MEQKKKYYLLQNKFTVCFTHLRSSNLSKNLFQLFIHHLYKNMENKKEEIV